jgi:hypothetical protein
MNVVVFFFFIIHWDCIYNLADEKFMLLKQGCWCLFSHSCLYGRWAFTILFGYPPCPLFYWGRVTSKGSLFVVDDSLFFPFISLFFPEKTNFNPYCCWCFRFSTLDFDFLSFSLLLRFYLFSILICKCTIFNLVLLLLILFFLFFYRSFYDINFILKIKFIFLLFQ